MNCAAFALPPLLLGFALLFLLRQRRGPILTGLALLLLFFGLLHVVYVMPGDIAPFAVIALEAGVLVYWVRRTSPNVGLGVSLLAGTLAVLAFGFEMALVDLVLSTRTLASGGELLRAAVHHMMNSYTARYVCGLEILMTAGAAVGHGLARRRLRSTGRGETPASSNHEG